MRQLLHAVRANNTFVAQLYVPLVADGATIGLVPKDRVAALRAFPSVFDGALANEVRLHSSLATETARTTAVQNVARELVGAGVIREKWKNEDYGARDGHGNVVFRVDRAAAAFFGITQCGCHLNGYVRHGPRPEDVSVWMGLRHASRSLWPGKWDSIVGGGLPLDISAWDNMLKEAREEASLAANDIAPLMRSAGVISYVNSEKEGLKHNSMFTFDLCMPPTMAPKSDGIEVDHFELWPITKALDLVERSPESFKPDICLLLIDFGIRHGIVTAANTSQFIAVARGLHAAPPF
ncbi:hypothetical protein ACHHYP_05203 [Achlya hypogyna]|uniref:Nudix hydrolase domain-containing protein n=1 Tax=Achlya hypogyna TaxID=1202772 RepID=A0A1V9YYP5_ACHHY|nr:hypothetical protein ACHHYP_05203 [Achlya hypogyna]